ncbi:WD repeat-containing protein 74 [Austrofundulus limnaeus]|uniref:WD repeat-containing protein 74 n=1 Tax=Austrofundulus limnaeus TaxID=52670 RepID=A0A2I4D978_AUSLI|nr:PREDICTED: WD repeat-containing protein 74 [Austrofundulus limnaeus]
MGDQSRLCSVWLGSETGILKGVSVAHKQAFNFCNTRQLTRDQEIRVLCWGDPTQSELLLGTVDGSVKTFSTEKGIFTEVRRCGDPEEGCFSGLEARNGSVLTCVESGKVRVWREDSSEPVSELDTGKNVCRMRQNPAQPNRVGTGGKENGLRIWDLERPDTPVFTAKNLRNDWLDLRRPHWVRDLDFIPNCDKVVTCTGYHQVHVFDPASPQRRPVLEADFGDHPLTALALPASGDSVVVGNTQGQLALLDLRKGLVRGCLKGLSGGVRALRCHASQPLVASCGLDRFLRIHSLEDRTLQHKVYLKSRLNCLLLGSLDLRGGAKPGAEGEVKEEQEEDEVWDNMEQVEEERTKRKSSSSSSSGGQKKKKKD